MAFRLGLLTFYTADRELFTNYDSITALWESSVQSSELRTKSSIQFSEPFQPNQTACFFSFQCLCSWFDLLLQSPPIKVLSVFCWHVFMVPVKQMQFLLHSPKKIFATCPYCKSIPVFTFNSVHSIVFIKNHYIKQISQ